MKKGSPAICFALCSVFLVLAQAQKPPGSETSTAEGRDAPNTSLTPRPGFLSNSSNYRAKDDVFTTIARVSSFSLFGMGDTRSGTLRERVYARVTEEFPEVPYTSLIDLALSANALWVLFIA